METISLADRLHLSNLYADFHKVYILSETWTTYLQNTKSVSKSDLPGLKTLTQEIDTTLNRCLKESNWLIRFTQTHKAELEKNFVAAKLSQKVRETINAQGGITALINETGASTNEPYLAFLNDMTQKMKSIESGNDLSTPFIAEAHNQGIGCRILVHTVFILADLGLWGWAQSVSEFAIEHDCWGGV